MQLVRVLHPGEYDKQRERFTSSALANSSDGSGISVVSVECAEQLLGFEGLCQHVRTFYHDITGVPPVFWLLDSQALENEFTEEPALSLKFEEKLSKTGDPCHRNMHGLSNSRASKYRKRYCQAPNISVCLDEGVVVPLTHVDLVKVL